MRKSLTSAGMCIYIMSAGEGVSATSDSLTRADVYIYIYRYYISAREGVPVMGESLTRAGVYIYSPSHE